MAAVCVSPATFPLKTPGDYSEVEATDPFHHLVRGIEEHFKTLSRPGLNEVDIGYLTQLMDGYTSNPADWQRYAHADPSRHYTRNCVVDLDGKANILILVWNPRKCSPVHDHARAHCLMKILQGSLKEELFTMPTSAPCRDTPLQSMKETVYSPNEVTYICDSIGLHRISNPSEDGQLAVSLHLYTPPNAADFGYCVYEEETGKRSFVRTSM